MDDELNDIRDLFKEEARELLSELEASLLKVEESPEDKEPVNSVFRAMHTVKGSGAACGFTDIAKFAHEVETVLDLVRNGKVAVTKELINLTLSARDTILLMLDTPDGNENAYKPGVEKDRYGAQEVTSGYQERGRRYHPSSARCSRRPGKNIKRTKGGGRYSDGFRPGRITSRRAADAGDAGEAPKG